MDKEVLSSNVLNYLVWRYLQEQGYASAALQLMHAWCPNPDELPFAANVQTKSLVKLVQYGLAYDDLTAKVSAQTRSFRFGKDHGPPNPLHPTIRRSMEERVSRIELPYYPDQHRLLDTPVTPLHLEADERLKPRAADDAMDVDMYPGDAAVGSDPDPDPDPMITTANTPPPSMGDIGVNAATQCEAPTDLTKNTILLDLGPDRPSPVANLRWSDGDDQVISVSRGSRLNHFFVNQPNELFAQFLTSRIIAGPSFEISRTCWIDKDECIVYGVDRTGSSHSQVAERGLLEQVWHVPVGDSVSLMATYPGLGMASRWNAESKMLLSLSATPSTTTVRVWQEIGSHVDPVIFNLATISYDAVWVSRTRFVVCTEQAVDVYELAEKHQEERSEEPFWKVRSIPNRHKWESLEFDAEYGMVGMISFETNSIGLIRADLEGPCEIKTYDDGRITGLKFQSGSASTVVEGRGEEPEGTAEPVPAMAAEGDSTREGDPSTQKADTAEVAEPTETTETAEPAESAQTDGLREGENRTSGHYSGTRHRVFAVSFDSGVVDFLLLRMGASEELQKELVPKEIRAIRRMCMPGVSAHAIDFSPNGRYLAAAGLNCVLVWETPQKIRSGGAGSPSESMPCAEWRWSLGEPGGWKVLPEHKEGGPRERQSNGVGSGRLAEGQEPEAELRHELRWDCRGRKLAFALGGQVAVIQFAV